MSRWVIGVSALLAGGALSAEPAPRPNDGKGTTQVPECDAGGYARLVQRVEATSAQCRTLFQGGGDFKARALASRRMLDLKVNLEAAWSKCGLSGTEQPSIWEIEVVWRPDANEWPDEFDGCFGAPFGVGYCGGVN